ncbi:MAG TPA: glycosyltransferase family 39 protein [Candidatus Binatia bacterium]
MTMQNWKQLAVAAAVCGWFCFWQLGAVSFIDPDEGMYGAIAREMSQSGDWVTPRFDGVRYLNKPPLLFWLSALTFKIFGPGEWGVRLWSALPALGAALLVWAMGRMLYGAAGGYFAALVFASSLGIFLYAHITLTDPLLVFSIALAMTGAVWTMRPEGGAEKPRKYSAEAGPLLFYLALALGMLTKGLIAVLLPAAIVGVFALITRNGRALSMIASRRAALGALLFLLIAAPWHFLAARDNPGFAGYYLLDNQLLRYLKGGTLIEDDVSVTTPAFLVLSLVWFLPWSFLLPAVLRRELGRPKRISPDEAMRLLPPLWAFVMLLFFSLSSSKLEHYSLPALPALALMTGGWWAGRLESPPSSSRWWRYPAIALIALSLSGLAWIQWGGSLPASRLLNIMGYYRAIEAQSYDMPPLVKTLAPWIARIVLAAVIGVSAAALLLSLEKVRAGFYAFVAAGAVIFVLLFRLVLLSEPYHSAKPIAEAVMARAGPGDLILHEDPLEYSGGLAYYTGKRVYIVDGRRGSLEFGARYPEAEEIFLDRRDLKKLWEGGRKLFLVTRLPPERSALGLLPGKEVFLLGQFGARRLYTNRE